MFAISKRPTISEIQALYIENKATVTQVVKFFLNRINETDRELNAFYCLTERLALEQAAKSDELLNEARQNQSDKGLSRLLKDYRLFGIPYAIKAIIQAEGEVFNASSKILDRFQAPYSSTVYEKVTTAGAILMGINNMDEFAMGSSGESGYYGKVKNPFDHSRIPGGSSAGGAACVGAGQVVFSLGTDTGGSIRQPSAFCDVVGLKPTYGLVSRWGVMPMASSFDQVGAMTSNVEDNILVTKVLAGKDAKDQTTVDSQKLVQALDAVYNKRKEGRVETNIIRSKKPLRIGIPKEFYIDGTDERIARAMSELQAKLKNLGHTLVDIELPLTKYAVAVYYMTMSVEVASNLERIDGIRYAAQQPGYSTLFFEHRGKYFGDEPKRRIMLGTYASSSGYYDAYYNHAQKVRELARRDFEKAFEVCDVILTPTTPEFPFKFGDKTEDPLKMYLSDVFTCGINPVRIPGLNVPLGLFNVDGVKLPTGCQILAGELEENLIYELALEVESVINDKKANIL